METKSGILTEERREFLKKVGGFAVLSTLGLSFFTSCGKDESPSPNNNQNPGDGGTGIVVSGNTITIDLDKQTALKNAGGWLLIPQAQTLVVNDGGIKALTSVCTHTGCDRNWTYSNSVFTCTCHGSRFNTAGAVVQGPANQPLRSFAVAVSNNIVTITK